MSDFGQPRWWERKFEFTETQWQNISKPLKGTAKVNPDDRLSLALIARQHGRLRDRRIWDFSRSETRQRLKRVTKLSARLRSEIFGTPDTFLDVEVANSDLAGRQGFAKMDAFLPYFRVLEQLEQKSRELADALIGKPEKPTHAAAARKGTLELLVQFYERVAGKAATITVGTDRSRENGAFAKKAIGPFVQFVQAFMSAVPDGEKLTGDQIKWFLDQRKKNGGRVSRIR